MLVFAAIGGGAVGALIMFFGYFVGVALVGADALERRQRAHQDVIHALELARLLHRSNILRLLDDADHVAIALVAPAESTRIRVGDVVTDRAVGDAFLHFSYGIDQPIRLLARCLQNIEGEALSPLRPDAGQALQLLDETQERIGEGHQRKSEV